ncbi:hypothetical protein GH714_014937 [Hevea brasiliensis]|uniref:Uncharacterized protein n=1 Tax=Hevea brasiliensis TaxID=3981 RepID=A0A6A6LK39_HEVBR|nr:hypothetical protein GH714_014937 [Hevea brasiliensis]
MSTNETPILWCDNVGAAYLTANPIFHAHMKHVEVDFHYVHDKVTKKELQVKYLSSQDQLADVLTKPLPRQRFTALRQQLTILPLADLQYQPTTLYSCIYIGYAIYNEQLFNFTVSMAAKVVKQVNSVLPVYNEIVPALLKDGVWNLSKTCSFTLGVPIGPMLAKSIKNISKIHCLENGLVEKYSRNAERNTGKYPDRLYGSFEEDPGFFNIGDSLDLVPIVAFHGRGKRAEALLLTFWLSTFAFGGSNAGGKLVMVILSMPEGISLRFPWLVKVREDKSPEKYSSSAEVVEMYNVQKLREQNKH